MLLGAVLPHHEIGSDPVAVKTYVQGLEAIGATHLLVYDHVLGADATKPGRTKGPYDKDVAFHEPLTFLAYVAGLTTTLELVTTVLIAPQRQTALLAKQTTEIAVLSGGRLRLGLGIGWNDVEYEALDVPFRQRGKRLDEQLDVLERLWTDDVVDYDGSFHRIDRASILPRPTAPIPVWFGGSSAAALARCARRGQGWMPLGGPSERAAERLQAIVGERQTAGLSMEGFGVQAQAQFAGGDADKWRATADRWRTFGATHLAFATHLTDPVDAEGHLARLERCFAAVAD